MPLSEQQFQQDLQQAAMLLGEVINVIGDLENRSLPMTDFIAKTAQLRQLAHQLEEIQMSVQRDLKEHPPIPAPEPPPTKQTEQGKKHHLFGG